MGIFYSPIGNREVWSNKPEDYLTEEEWFKLHEEVVGEQEGPEVSVSERVETLEGVIISLLKGELNV